MNIYSITTLATMMACTGILIIAILRLRLCEGGYRARCKYTLTLIGAMAGLCQPIMIYMWPGATELLLSAVLLVVLISGVPPLKAYKDSNDFFDTEIYNPRIHGEDL